MDALPRLQKVSERPVRVDSPVREAAIWLIYICPRRYIFSLYLYGSFRAHIAFLNYNDVAGRAALRTVLPICLQR